MTKLEAAIAEGKRLGKTALYFGCLDGPGHYLHFAGRRTLAPEDVPGFPWSIGLLDTGLLKNGKHADIYDGKVFWTCGGSTSFWYAFFWWDRSVDTRGGSNSGFYVRGFGWPEAQDAFNFACEIFPKIISRQKYPLILSRG